jgi:hypothetical protein
MQDQLPDPTPDAARTSELVTSEARLHISFEQPNMVRYSTITVKHFFELVSSKWYKLGVRPKPMVTSMALLKPKTVA